MIIILSNNLSSNIINQLKLIIEELENLNPGDAQESSVQEIIT